MTEVRSKRRAFYPVIFTSICFKKPSETRKINVRHAGELKSNNMMKECGD